MNRYQKYMQHIHNQGIARDIEMAIACFAEDVVELLAENGVKKNAPLLNTIRSLQKYEYGKIAPINNEPCAPK